jgi:hypothetical protein
VEKQIDDGYEGASKDGRVIWHSMIVYAHGEIRRWKPSPSPSSPDYRIDLSRCQKRLGEALELPIHAFLSPD